MVKGRGRWKEDAEGGEKKMVDKGRGVENRGEVGEKKWREEGGEWRAGFVGRKSKRW